MNEYILYYIRCIRRSKFELRIDINAMAMFIYLTSMIRCYHRKRAKTMIYRTEGGTIALWKFTGGGVHPPPPPGPPWLRACFQVQSWLGRDDLEVLEWGWVLTSQMLMPIMMSLAAAPQDM